jgi:hypothetical protein
MNPGAMKPSSPNSATAGPEIPIPVAVLFEVPAPLGLGARSGSGVPAVLARDAAEGRTCRREFEIPLRGSGAQSSTVRAETGSSDSGSASMCASVKKAPCADRTTIMDGS